MSGAGQVRRFKTQAVAEREDLPSAGPPMPEKVADPAAHGVLFGLPIPDERLEEKSVGRLVEPPQIVGPNVVPNIGATQIVGHARA